MHRPIHWYNSSVYETFLVAYIFITLSWMKIEMDQTNRLIWEGLGNCRIDTTEPNGQTRRTRSYPSDRYCNANPDYNLEDPVTLVCWSWKTGHQKKEHAFLGPPPPREVLKVKTIALGFPEVSRNRKREMKKHFAESLEAVRSKVRPMSVHSSFCNKLIWLEITTFWNIQVNLILIF